MNQIKYFILLGRIEAISLLLLLFVAMPVKYLLHEPLLVRIVGSLHGLLFMGYAFLAFLRFQEDRWSNGKLVACLVLSSLPFGTYYFEQKMLSKS